MTSTKIVPFLMFEGAAEEAMKFYISLFPDAAITELIRYGANGPGAAGSVLKATFQLAGQIIMCSDSFVHHSFTFTPASSLFVQCESEDQIRRLVSALADKGAVLMPLGNYGFSRNFAWITDRFGVSWQLQLA